MEEGAYLSRLFAYVHLNPVRAGLVKRKDGLETYPWSSLSDYVKPPSKRRDWVAVTRELEQLEYPDTVAGVIRKRSLVSNSWLAEELDMGVPNAVSRTIRLARERTMGERRIRQLARRLERRIGAE